MKMKVKLDWSTFPSEMDVSENTEFIHIPLITGDVEIGPENKTYTVVNPSRTLIFQRTAIDDNGTPIFTFLKGT